MADKTSHRLVILLFMPSGAITIGHSDKAYTLASYALSLIFVTYKLPLGSIGNWLLEEYSKKEFIKFHCAISEN